jgi:hypothetical protein
MTTEKPTERSGRTRKNAADDPADTEEQDPVTEEPDGAPELSYRARQRIRARLVRKYH